MREINKSLSSLNRVFAALKEKVSKKDIPYRDNKLTYLMKDSIGGNVRSPLKLLEQDAYVCKSESCSVECDRVEHIADVRRNGERNKK